MYQTVCLLWGRPFNPAPGPGSLAQTVCLKPSQAWDFVVCPYEYPLLGAQVRSAGYLLMELWILLAEPRGRDAVSSNHLGKHSSDPVNTSARCPDGVIYNPICVFPHTPPLSLQIG